MKSDKFLALVNENKSQAHDTASIINDLKYLLLGLIQHLLVQKEMIGIIIPIGLLKVDRKPILTLYKRFL